MLEGLKKFWQMLKKLKLGFLVFILSTLGFFVLFFPLNDLGDLITTQVSNMSRNQVYFQFDGLKLSVLPPGLNMSNVFIETSQLSALKAKEVTVLPSISGMIKGRPYGHINAEGFLKGGLSLNVSAGSKGEKSAESAVIELSAKKLSIKEVRTLLNLPFFMQGEINAESKATLFFTIKQEPEKAPIFSIEDQPDMEMNITVSKFELPPTSVSLGGMGDITLPELKLKQVDLKGKLSNGVFTIEKGELGQVGDDLQMTLKGTMNVSLQPSFDGRIIPQLGAYNLDIDLKTQKSFQDKAGLFLSFIQSHQKAPGQYKFKVASPMWGAPPQITTLR
jgi:type II secretion system protein N